MEAMKVYYSGRYYQADCTINEREFLMAHAPHLYAKLFPAPPTCKLKNKAHHIYQVYYDKKSMEALDSGFISYKNGTNHNFENDIILDIWKKRTWVDAKYVGVLSWRFYEKTLLTSDMIKPKTDVVVFFPKNYERFEHPFSRRGYGSVNAMVDYADKMKLFPFKLRDYPVEDICWCNYWIARPKIFDDYCTRYLSKAIEFFKGTPLYNATEKHRGKDCLSMTFFLEGLFSVFLKNEKIKYIFVK